MCNRGTGCEMGAHQSVTERLHNLIDAGADQRAINERVAGIMDGQARDVIALSKAVETITDDHEKRLRYLERTVAWSLGVVGSIAAIVLIVTQVIHWFK